MQRGGVPHAPASSDAEFLRRIYLDMTGRLPDPAVASKFLAAKEPDKRQKLIDSLFPPLPVPGMRSVSEDPFFDRWTYFFCDLFRNGQLLQEGINTFYDYIYKLPAVHREGYAPGLRPYLGQLDASSDAESANVVEFGWRRPRPIYTEDICATIYSTLGIDWTKRITNTPSGRDFVYVDPAAGQKVVDFQEVTDLFEA